MPADGPPQQVRICVSPDCGVRFPAPEGYADERGCPLCDAPTTGDRELVNYAPSITTTSSSLTLAGLVDNVRSAANVGSMIRTADAVAMSPIFLCGITATPKHRGVTKASLGAEHSVEWSQRPNAVLLADELLADGWTLIALESTPHAIGPSELLTASLPQKLVLIAGHEVAGVDPDLQDRAGYHLSLPMLGLKESLNVSVAFGIAAHMLRSH